MRLIIVRHGETKHNAGALMVAHGPSRLNVKGRAQVQRVAGRLRSEHFDAAFSSDSERALHTAQGILQFHPNVKLEVTEEIRERHMGHLEGKSREKFNAAAQQSGMKWYDYKPIDGESMMDTQARAKQFIEHIRDGHRGQTVLLVSHGGFIRALLAYLLKQNYEDHPPIRVLNTAITIVQMKDDGSHIAHIINDATHLDEETRPIVRALGEHEK